MIFFFFLKISTICIVFAIKHHIVMKHLKRYMNAVLIYLHNQKYMKSIKELVEIFCSKMYSCWETFLVSCLCCAETVVMNAEKRFSSLSLIFCCRATWFPTIKTRTDGSRYLNIRKFCVGMKGKIRPQTYWECWRLGVDNLVYVSSQFWISPS